MALGLRAASNLEVSNGRTPLYCLPNDEQISLALLMKLLNTRLAGATNQTGEMIAEAAAAALNEEYGCEKDV
jgi:hypothetical protein